MSCRRAYKTIWQEFTLFWQMMLGHMATCYLDPKGEQECMWHMMCSKYTANHFGCNHPQPTSLGEKTRHKLLPPESKKNYRNLQKRFRYSCLYTITTWRSHLLKVQAPSLIWFSRLHSFRSISITTSDWLEILGVEKRPSLRQYIIALAHVVHSLDSQISPPKLIFPETTSHHVPRFWIWWSCWSLAREKKQKGQQKMGVLFFC